jgi:pimeloyl-ACP methyl ester carboxylesterase
MDLYAEVAGEGSTVVLVHAGICDSRMWDPQWDAFPAAYRRVRYDLRGFGRSPLPPQPYSHGHDLIALLERLGIQQATLVGASLGGRVAMEVAVARPAVVDGLVVAGAALPGFAWSGALRAFWAEEDAALERGDLDAAVEVNLRMWVDGPRRPSGAVNPAVRESVRQMQRRAFELQLPVWEDAEEELLVSDLARRLDVVRARTLVLVGEEDVSDFQQIAAQLAREIPSAQHAVIPNAAHLPSLERAAAFNELILRFLARDRF